MLDMCKVTIESLKFRLMKYANRFIQAASVKLSECIAMQVISCQSNSMELSASSDATSG
jgi:hypothetical protein